MPLTVPPYARRIVGGIYPWSWGALGGTLAVWGLNIGNTSTAWPLANLAILVPFSTWETVTIKEVEWYCGTVTGNNVDIGIYDSTGVNRLASLGGVSRGTASAPNTSTTFTDYVLAPGNYYMAQSCDATATFAAVTTTASLLAAAGVLEAPTAYVLPATLSPVVTTRTLLPGFGLLIDSTAL